jgi:hypothetical protein
MSQMYIIKNLKKLFAVENYLNSNFYFSPFSCFGKTTCQITADNRFGDPCIGYTKYMEITYWCRTTLPPT